MFLESKRSTLLVRGSFRRTFIKVCVLFLKTVGMLLLTAKKCAKTTRAFGGKLVLSLYRTETSATSRFLSLIARAFTA